MNPNVPQGPPPGQPLPPIVTAPAHLYKPEEMRELPPYQFGEADRAKYERGLAQLWKQFDEPPEPQARLEAQKKIQDFSRSLYQKLQQYHGRALPNSQARPGGQGQGQPPGQGPSMNPNQPNNPNAPRPGQPSQQLRDHVERFIYAPPQHFVPGSQEYNGWIAQAKEKYCKALMTMENTSTRLKTLEAKKREREQNGSPLTDAENGHYQASKEQTIKQHNEAKTFVDNFRKQQGRQLAASAAAGQQTGNAVQNAGPPSSQGQAPPAPTAPARPASNPQQPDPTLQNTQTVNAAIEAARNQQMGGVRQQVQTAVSSGPQQPGQTSQPPLAPPQSAPSSSGTMINQGPSQVNVKIEGGSQPNPNAAPGAMNAAPVAMPQNPMAQMQRQQAPGNLNSPQSAVPTSATASGTVQPTPLSHQAALSKAARSYSSGQTTGTPNVMASHSHPSISSGNGSSSINSTKSMQIAKVLPERATAPPQPVQMQPSRPTLTGGPSGAGGGVTNQPVLQKTSGVEAIGENSERILNKKKLDELVRQVTGGGEGLESGEGLSTDVEDSILDVADEFVDQVITAACKCAKSRGSKVLEIRDIQLVLERNYNIRIPGYASDEIRTVRKFQPAQGWVAKMSAVQAAKVTGGKGDN